MKTFRTKASRAPSPVALGRYRYSKIRWRILVGLIDGVGSVFSSLWRRLRPPQTIDNPRRILVVQLDHLGDAVLSSPLIERLRTAFPSAVLDILASPSNHEVFEADENLDRVHIAEKNWFERRRGQAAMLTAVWKLGLSLRAKKYELGIDVRGDILTVLVLALAGIPRRAGWSMGGGGFLLTDITPWVRGRHEVESRMAILETLEIPVEGPVKVSIAISDRDRSAVALALNQTRPDSALSRSSRTIGQSWDHFDDFSDEAPLLVVHPGAGTSAKRWPLAYWNRLLRRFSSEGWRIVLIGGAEDVDASAILSNHANLANMTGRMSVTQTAALLERADLFIGADSGPSHLAACAGAPSVVLFSGTNLAKQWRPRSRRTLVLRKRVACSPCHQKVCPLADHPCMNGLDPDRVHLAAIRWLSRLQRMESGNVDR